MQTYFFFKVIPSGISRVAENPSIVDYDAVQVLEGKANLPKQIFRVKKGFEKFDFLETELPGVFLCSKRVVSVLTEQNIQGWRTTKVALEYKGVRVKEEYYIFHVYGKSNEFDYSKSEFVGKIANSFVELKGRYFDEGSITADIFVVDKTVMIFVNEKVMNLMTKEKISNVSFTPNSEIVSAVSAKVYKLPS